MLYQNDLYNLEFLIDDGKYQLSRNEVHQLFLSLKVIEYSDITSRNKSKE
jgi:hypothetical protein